MKGNVIFYIALLIIVVSLVTAGQIGKSQDLQMKQTYAVYLAAVKNIDNQQGNLAIPDLEKLAKEFPERNNVHRNLGLAYSQTGKYKEALEQFEIALKIRPTLIKVPYFNAQYGEVAYNLKQYDKAKAFFLESINTGISGDLRTYVDQMLTRIATIEKAGGAQ
jgi:tetratricopeptide (TPR) repeat protein